MPRKKTKEPEIKSTAEIRDQHITETIESNYMPYVMTVIVSRAIPEIDGFKPSQRKLLYTMYRMGLMTKVRTKSTNVVGETMKLNPHGDAAIYDTMVRLTRGNEALLHPFIDSKGSFGKQYSRDMAPAAPRYTEAKLDAFCTEIFGGIEKNAVEMIPNYDNTTTEPSLFQTSSCLPIPGLPWDSSPVSAPSIWRRFVTVRLPCSRNRTFPWISCSTL